jgi:hypothetical protein
MPMPTETVNNCRFDLTTHDLDACQWLPFHGILGLSRSYSTRLLVNFVIDHFSSDVALNLEALEPVNHSEMTEKSAFRVARKMLKNIQS